MAIKFLCIVVCVILIYVEGTNAFNITSMLQNRFPTFNRYLTEADLTAEINGLQKVTILALEDNAMEALSRGKSMGYVKAVLSTQILPEFYNKWMVARVVTAKALMETLYERKGRATNGQGYLRATFLKDHLPPAQPEGGIAFASAAPGASFNSTLLAGMVAERGVVSILTISAAIVTPGITDLD